MVKPKIAGYPRSGISLLCALIIKNFYFGQDTVKRIDVPDGLVWNSMEGENIRGGDGGNDRSAEINFYDIIASEDEFHEGEFDVLVYRNPIDVLYSIYMLGRRTGFSYNHIEPDEPDKQEDFSEWIERSYIEEFCHFTYKNLPGRNDRVNFAIPYESLVSENTFSGIMQNIEDIFDLEKRLKSGYKYVDNKVGFNPHSAEKGYDSKISREMRCYFGEVIGDKLLCYQFETIK